MSETDLPLGVSVRQGRLEDRQPGVLFEIEHNGHRMVFSLREDEALAIALAILKVSVEIRDGVSPQWRPHLIEGGRE